MTNAPIGVPSGWEERAALWMATPFKFSIVRKWDWLSHAFAAASYAVNRHDWRVVE